MINTLPGFLATNKHLFWLMLGLGLLLLSLIVLTVITNNHSMTGHTVALWDYEIDGLKSKRG